MPIEIEAKIKVSGHAAIRARLIERRAGRVGQVLEANTFLDRPDGSLRDSDQGLRVRRMRNLQTGSDESVMTYKGSCAPGELKSREELEIRVDDPQTAMLLLERLGFQRTLSFEKRRESWLLDGCKVELDELPYLGDFVEIEGPDDASVQIVRGRLGLESEPVERRSYATLLAHYLRDHHIDNRVLTFDVPVA